MKKKIKKFLLRTLEVGLSVFMMASFVVNAISLDSKVRKESITVAASEVMEGLNKSVDSNTLLSTKEYVKDVKFIRAASLAEAKTRVPKGYTMVETDLNQGAAVVSAVDDIYLAYSVTTNPDEAITDIKMMNMKGGYVVSDYDKQVNNVDIKIQNMVLEFKTAVEAFVANYKKGTYGAKAAYATLSAFTVDEENNQTLAEYFLSEKVPDGFYLKMLLNTHMEVLASVFSALTAAVQGEPGDTWLDRLAKIDDPYSITNSLYWDQAVDLLPHFTSFYESYSVIDHEALRGPKGPLYVPPEGSENSSEDSVDSADSTDSMDSMDSTDSTDSTDSAADSSSAEPEPEIDFSDGEIFMELAHITMEAYSFGDGTLVSDWLVCDYIYEEMLYPLIEVLTPAEYAMMHLCGPMYMVYATAMNEEVYEDYKKRADDIIKESGTCSVWLGVDTELLRSSIAITDAARRAIVETEAEQQFNDQGDSAMDTMLKTAGLFAASGLVAFGTGLLIVNLFGSSLFAGFVGSAAALSAQAWAVTAFAGVVCSCAGVTAIIVALVMVVIYLVVWLVDWIASYYPDLTEIPEYMYDYVMTPTDTGYFLLYEAAQDQNGEFVDVNAFDGAEWHVPYITRDKNAGAPIEADFMVRLGDGRLDKGYSALSAFGNVNCENMNRYAFEDEVNGIFVSYRQEDLYGERVKGKYLYDAKLFTAEDEEHCKIKLANEDFFLYNVNLTPDANYATYLGYKTTNKASDALTDLRFAYAYTVTTYNAGGGNLSYGASGTSGDLTLYTTRISTFGTPIYSDLMLVHDRKDAPMGYEPINMFSGGSAVNINVDGLKYIDENEPYYLYFRPTKAYVSGTEYIGGIAMMYDVTWEGYYNGQSSVINAAIDMDYYLLSSVKGKMYGDVQGEVECAVIYTTTYNPYRAIYDVGAMSLGGEMGDIFNETITYFNKGYVMATRYVVDHNNHVLFDSNTRANDTKLYVAGPAYGNKPLKRGEVGGSSVMLDNLPEGYRAVSAFLSESDSPVNVTSGLHYSYRYGYSGNMTMKLNMDPLYMYVRGAAYQEGEYLTSVHIVSKEQVLGGQDIECSILDNSYVMNALSTKGVDTVVKKNLNLKDSDNATYLGYKKDPTVRNPITDMFLYYAGNTDKEPDVKYVKDNIEYQLASTVNIFCKENHETKSCKRVYLYTTTNPAAGDFIREIVIDNNAILDGWQTVRTQNGKALYDDMDEHSDSMWFIHMKRSTETPKYISELVVGWGNNADAKAKLLAAGCDYMLTKDLNDGVGILSNYIYLGYKRTSDPNEAIRDIRTVHNESYTSFVLNGCTYKRVEGNLNSWTNYFADDIYFFYTKDAAAGNPIIEIETSNKAANWTYGEGNKYEVTTVLNQKNKASDLNDGAFGDYIYLLQTRELTGTGAVASMIGQGSVLIIITCVAVSACIVEWLYIVKKKRQNQEQPENNAPGNQE